MSTMIIVAGPQAVGKSTIITELASRYQIAFELFPERNLPLLFPMQESRQIIVHKHMLLGEISMSTAHEREVVSCDFERMDFILRRDGDRLVHLDECNIFTIAHAQAHGMGDIARY